MPAEWTKEEIDEFDRLLDLTSSRNQMDRISGRIDLNAFVGRHGKEKCDAMFAYLEKSKNV
jgi:hypothetical protein